jgi:hypothetical protein
MSGRVLKALCSLVAVCFLALSATAAQADVIIAGNGAAFGNGPIGTFNFTTGLPVGSFIPDGAFGSNNGRGLAMTLDRYFYTELTSGFGPTDSIRIAPFNGGAGGADIGSFANPVPGKGIQDLAFGAAGLYVLTGYPSLPPQVWILNGVTGAIVGGPITLAGADSGMDGFTVLPDGSFLGNLGDADNHFTHWDAAGNNIGGNFSVPGCGSVTGVDIAPDGLSLYFACNFNSFVQTDLTGLNVLGSISAPGGAWEDIAIQQQFICVGESCTASNGVPAPPTLIILGVGVLGFAVFGRARRSRKSGQAS